MNEIANFWKEEIEFTLNDLKITREYILLNYPRSIWEKELFSDDKTVKQIEEYAFYILNKIWDSYFKKNGWTGAIFSSQKQRPTNFLSRRAGEYQRIIDKRRNEYVNKVKNQAEIEVNELNEKMQTLERATQQLISEKQTLEKTKTELEDNVNALAQSKTELENSLTEAKKKTWRKTKTFGTWRSKIKRWYRTHKLFD